MKKYLSIIISVICIAALTATVLSSNAVSSNTSPAKTVKGSVNETRFLNMLNHNCVYDGDFDDADLIAYDSIFSLLGARKGDFIEEDVLKGFVKDMYGVEILSIDGVCDGLVGIPVCGYTTYKHKILSTVKNEDGSFLVTSSVTVTPHDGDTYKARVSTLFVKNGESAFGYNIIYSNFLNDASDI